MLTVSDNIVVSMDYSLRLTDGQVIDSSEGREPLEFVTGQGQIIPGLEKALYGMSLGDEKDVVVQPSEGYGEFDSDLFETLPRSVFPADVELEEGMGFRMRTDGGQIVVAYVDSIEDDQVTVNLNHPLAGETLYFKVKIAGLREATEQDLAGCSGSCGSCGCGCGEDDEDCGCDDEEGCCCHN